jgi:hypothetical protein
MEFFTRASIVTSNVVEVEKTAIYSTEMVVDGEKK